MITLIIIAITVGVSILTMNDLDLKNRFMFNAYAISHRREWWRFFSHGLLHANFPHLFFNMYSLYLFGTFVENTFKSDEFFGLAGGTAIYLFMYIGGLFFSSIYTYFKNKDNISYNALGASGAVSAVVFASILLSPLSEMGLMLVPVMIPAWIFGFIYLAASWFMARRNIGNIGHDAHFWGAVFGFILPIIFKHELLSEFVFQIKLFFQFGGIPH